MKRITINDGLQTIIDYRGKTPPKSESGITLISAANIKSGTLDFSRREFISKEDYLDWTTRGFTKPGDVLFTTEAPTAEVALYPDKGTYQISRRVIALRTDENLLHNLYLFYLLQSPPIKRKMLSANRGSTVPRLLKTDITDFSIEVPDYSEQKEVAKTLSCLDRKIENLRKQNETLERIAQTLFKHWFIDFEFPNAAGEPYKSSGGEMEPSELGEIPAGWRVGNIEDLFDFLEGPGIRNWQYTETGTRFINIRLIQNGDIEVENANCIESEEANGKYNHFHLKPKDLVISTSGTLGRCAIVRKEHLPLILNTSVIRFRPNNQNDYEFMYQLFQSKYFTHNLKSLASGSVQLNFGPMHLRQIKIFIPTRHILNQKC